jgi:hypothetical protein
VHGVVAAQPQPVGEVGGTTDQGVVHVDDLELDAERVQRRPGLPVLGGGQPPAALDPRERGRSLHIHDAARDDGVGRAPELRTRRARRFRDE